MSNYKLSRKAFFDLVEMGKYTARKWSVRQRNVYLKQIDSCFAELANNPQRAGGQVFHFDILISSLFFFSENNQELNFQMSK